MLDEAVGNLRKFTGTDLATAVRMASANPARMLRLPQPVSIGQPANFNIFDGHGRRSGAVVRGTLLEPRK
jgi:N-acetylglucosamine-6-phosphate deacetylase